MQPCPVCGGMGIDANGYCTQCRTYRGLPQAPPPSSGAPYGPQYGGAPPYSGPPYGAPPPPQVGYPTSPGPAYPQQTSAPPTAYPPTTYGGAYGAPTAPRKTRSSFTTPLIALSATLVVLVIAIVIVVVVKNSGSKGGGNNPSALVDDCVVGTWEMSAYSEDVPVAQVGAVKFTLNGKGATIKFTKDGKGTQDFGTGTVFSGDVAAAGQTVRVNLTLAGKVTYDVRTNDNTMSFSNPTSDVKATVSAPSLGVNESQNYEPSTDPSKYSCSDDTMSMTTSAYKSDLKRVSRDA